MLNRMYESENNNEMELVKSKNIYNNIKNISNLILDLFTKNITPDILKNLQVLFN